MIVIKPRAELRPYVRYYWMLRSDEPLSVLTFPIGCPQMIFHRQSPLYIPELDTCQSQFTISGQVNYPAYIRSDGNLDMIVAVFYPHTIGMFIDTPPSSFYNLEISGFDVGNRQLSELARMICECEDDRECIAALEGFLMSKIRPSLNIRRIGESVRTLLRTPSARVSALAGRACLGKRQFGRVFGETVGMNPKEYARVVQFQKALWLMQTGDGNYAGIAAECGYADQSHFVRSCRALGGHTPDTLMKRYRIYSDLYSDPV